MEMERNDAAVFSLLTYNINDGAYSSSAPDSWNMDLQYDGFCDVICTHSPDLLCLQECFQYPARLSNKYEFHGQASSHRGNCCIATRKGSLLQADGPSFTEGPCILLPLRLGDRRFVAASAHLAPFRELGPKRAEQVARVAASVPAEVPLMLAGDLNMRENETGLAARNGLVDAWVAMGSPPSLRWTWDTKINKYYEGGHAYSARYDRLLYRGFKVLEFAIAANQPCSAVHGHFLSDHFGLLARVQLE